MKKLLALLLVAVLVFGLVACGNGTPAATPTPAPATPAPGGEPTPEPPAPAVNWPTRPVTIVVPLAPGGDTDLTARIYARFLTELLGQPFTVINVEGAGGTVGATQVSHGNPDGYTVLWYHTGNLFSNQLTGATDLNHYDFVMSTIGMYCDANILVAYPGLFADAEDFLERARANPGQYNAAVAITGVSGMAMRLLERYGHFETNLVDVGGGGAIAASVMGGHTELGIGNVVQFASHIEAGTLQPLMIASTQRSIVFPDIPTVAELGLGGAEFGRSYFFAFPQNTDPAIAQALSDAVAEIQNNPEYVEIMQETSGMPTFFLPMAEVMDHISERWADIEFMKAYMQ
ncbi:MAG: tripartite tricarboxylate transporter substrate binding protein [Oscillospiraceae bacterium]|nr:tripartite tricarboxylate transporter substrate binding protein [Oscillospiraceae bacterium]